MKNISKRQIETRLARFDDDHRERLKGLYELWRNPTAQKSLTQWQLRELQKAGLVKDETGLVAGDAALPDGLPKFASGAELARILTTQFGSLVSSVQISRALRDDGMTGRQPNGSWKVADAIAWWKRHRANLGEDYSELSARANVAEMEKKISDAKRARVEADEAARLLDSKWILRADADFTCKAVATTYHALARKCLDTNFAKLVLSRLNQSDFSEAQRNAIEIAARDSGREIVTAISNACHSYEPPKEN